MYDENGKKHFNYPLESEYSEHEIKTLRESGLRDTYHCLIAGVETEDGGLHTPNPARPFAEGDVIWLVGEPKDLDTLP